MQSLLLRRLHLNNFPGRAGVKHNERADRLASKTDMTTGKKTAWQGRNTGTFEEFFEYEQNRASQHRPKDGGVGTRSGQSSTLRGWEGNALNQTSASIVSRATLGKLLRDGAKGVWAFLIATPPRWPSG